MIMISSALGLEVPLNTRGLVFDNAGRAIRFAGRDESMADPTDILDLDQAARLIPNGPEGVKEMAQLLVEETTLQLQKMRDGLAGEDAKSVYRAAHTVKGSVDIFGAKAVVEAAQRAMEMAKEGKLEEVRAGFAELEEEVVRLHAALRAVVDGDPA
jgi:HPt (histidine-containing phosphotransfer) domain-containing protein